MSLHQSQGANFNNLLNYLFPPIALPPAGWFEHEEDEGPFEIEDEENWDEELEANHDDDYIWIMPVVDYGKYKYLGFIFQIELSADILILHIHRHHCNKETLSYFKSECEDCIVNLKVLL